MLEKIKLNYKKDIIILFGIISIGIIILLISAFAKKTGDIVLISVDGMQKMVLDITKDGEYVIEGTNGNNVLAIVDGKVYMNEASCPDKLCVNMGEISASGQTIICLPNRIVVEISGKSESLDATTY